MDTTLDIFLETFNEQLAISAQRDDSLVDFDWSQMLYVFVERHSFIHVNIIQSPRVCFSFVVFRTNYTKAKHKLCNCICHMGIVNVHKKRD